MSPLDLSHLFKIYLFIHLFNGYESFDCMCVYLPHV